MCQWCLVQMAHFKFILYFSAELSCLSSQTLLLLPSHNGEGEPVLAFHGAREDRQLSLLPLFPLIG